MTAMELIVRLSEIPPNTDVRILLDDIFWPICYEDSMFIQTPGDKDVMMICPCYGHSEQKGYTEDYHPDEDEIIPN